MIYVTGREDYIYLASVALYNMYSKEEFLRSSYMKGNENHLNNVWNIVEESRSKGLEWFYQNYKDYKLFRK